VLAAAEVRRQLRFAQLLPEQDDLVAHAIARIDRYERRIHADFEQLLAAPVDDYRRFLHVVAVPGQNDAHVRAVEPRITHAAFGFAHHGQP